MTALELLALVCESASSKVEVGRGIELEEVSVLVLAFFVLLSRSSFISVETGAGVD